MTASATFIRAQHFTPHVPRVLSTRDVVERMSNNPFYEAMITAGFILPGRLKPQANTWDSIIEAVAEKHSLTVAEMMSKSRKRHVAWARFEAWAEIYKTIPGVSYPKIGAKFDTDHSTVRQGIHRFRELSAAGYMP